MSNIDDLKRKVQSLQDQLRAATEAYNAARIFEYEIKVGQIFTDKKGRRGEVVRHIIRYGEIQPVLRLFKKDGSLGEHRVDMYRWDHWTLVP
jgi:hypothetical protein